MSGDPFTSVFEVAGVPIHAVDLASASRLLCERRAVGAVHLCNAYTVALASQRKELLHVLRRADLNLPDGKPLVWIARRQGLHHLVDRTYGPDLMASVLDLGRKSGVRHYLYGSTTEVLEMLTAQITLRWPGAEVVATEAPPFGEFSDEEIRDAERRFSEAEADIVWVGLGTPKQDFEVDRFAALGGRTYVAIGAAFDFIAGTKAMAPASMQRLGLEWLFRLLQEPRRLWKRYLIGNTKFIIAAVRSGSLRRHTGR